MWTISAFLAGTVLGAWIANRIWSWTLAKLGRQLREEKTVTLDGITYHLVNLRPGGATQ